MLLNDIKAYRVVSNDLVSKMKNFLEGEGFELNEKMGRKRLIFKNTYQLITSNDLPPSRLTKDGASDWEPFTYRCETIELKEVYSSDTKPCFTKVDVCRYWMEKY